MTVDYWRVQRSQGGGGPGVGSQMRDELRDVIYFSW